MIRRSLREVEQLSGGQGLSDSFYNIEIEGVSTDTREIRKNNLFIPLVGENFDGHKFLDQAIENGAIASLWQKDRPLPDRDFPLIIVEDSLEALQTLAKNYRKSLKDIRVVAITGSNGKTSTKDIMDGILSRKYRTKKTRGNLNNHIGLPLTLLELEEDTQVSIVEMGTDGFGQIELLTKLALPDMAMITNIGPSHLDLLKTEENVARAKFEILEGLKANGSFIYNGDDGYLKKIIDEYRIDQEIISFGRDGSNDIRAELLSEGSQGLVFNIEEDARLYKLKLPMIGPHNLYNAAASIVVARKLGMDYELIQEGLYNIDETEMRNEIIEGEDFTILNDAYKSNPNSLLAALDTLYSIEGYRHRALVLGDMLDLGDNIVELHREVGRKIDSEKVDQIFTLGDLAKEIGQAASPNFSKEAIFHADSKEELLDLILNNIKKGSLVLVKASRSVALEDLIDQLKKD